MRGHFGSRPIQPDLDASWTPLHILSFLQHPARDEVLQRSSKSSAHCDVQQRVDSRVRVHEEERNGGEQVRHRGVVLVRGQEVLEHLPGVEREGAESEADHNHDEHVDDLPSRLKDDWRWLEDDRPRHAF